MGRRALFGTAATALIRVRVTPEQRQELLRVAQDNRTDVSSVIREAVNEFVADYRETVPFRGTKSAA